jgi:outer membrane murein-binding lipoprotein Lpp
MFRRRRPLLRAAAVGGGAYLAGKRHARHSAQDQQAEEEQNARIDGLEQQAPAQAPDQRASPAQAPASSSPMIDQVNQLAALHQQGVLTDGEFAAAKAKLLGT